MGRGGGWGSAFAGGGPRRHDPAAARAAVLYSLSHMCAVAGPGRAGRIGYWCLARTFGAVQRSPQRCRRPAAALAGRWEGPLMRAPAAAAQYSAARAAVLVTDGYSGGSESVQTVPVV